MEGILSIGLDHDLLSTREPVLEQTGAMVHSTQPETARKMLKVEVFDLVVICHTVHPRDVGQICRDVEKFCPACQVLSLVPFDGSPCNSRCLQVEFNWQDGPGALVRLIRNLLHPEAEAPIRSTRLGLHLIRQSAVRA